MNTSGSTCNVIVNGFTSVNYLSDELAFRLLNDEPCERLTFANNPQTAELTLDELYYFQKQFQEEREKVVASQRYEEAAKVRENQRKVNELIMNKESQLIKAFLVEVNMLMEKHGIEQRDGNYIIKRTK